MYEQKAVMKCVSHEQATQLLHNKFIVVLGDSIQRSVYKDLVLLLQKDTFLSPRQLKSKGEMSFEQDCLVEGGCLGQMHNQTDYREVRQFQSDHHLVRFYFVTRIYSRYMQSILEDFRQGLKPDVLIVNSCVWDISRYLSTWMDDYKENLQQFFTELKGILPEESLVIWTLTMPLGERIKGGFLVPEIEHKAARLRYDVIEANFHSATLADSFGMDVLDLHYQFRYFLYHRIKDGVHWNALAHRRITSQLLQHTAQAWGVVMPCPPTTVEHTEDTDQLSSYAAKPAERQPSGGNYSYSKELVRESFPFGHFNSEQPQRYSHKAAWVYRPAIPPLHHPPDYRCKHRPVGHDLGYRPLHHREPDEQQHHHHHYVMRSHHSRHRYAPYAHRPGLYGRHLDY